MKYFFIAILSVLLISPVYAELLTEKEALAKMQAEMDEFYSNPPTEADRERARREMIERSQIPHVYTGSGDILDDRDVYIGGKLYHCVQYQFNTQCHID